MIDDYGFEEEREKDYEKRQVKNDKTLDGLWNALNE